MPKFLLSPLAGAYFRPPAKQIVGALPSGASLILEREDDNPYDEAAVKVLVGLGEVPEGQHEALREALPGSGHDWDELLAAGEALHIGYVAKSGGKPLLDAQKTDPELVGNLEFRCAIREWPASAELSFTIEGKPAVKLELE